MAKLENCKLELELEAQMPMIHFQSKQTGATLRASEVKPKLDRFILAQLMKDKKCTVKQLKNDMNYKGLFIDCESENNDALDYKMQITDSEFVQEVDLMSNNNKYQLLYANNRRWGVFSNPTVTIICFKKELKELIEKYVEMFFVLTNFGYMQNKGFGSFAPKKWLASQSDNDGLVKCVAGYYKDVNEKGCYYMMHIPRNKDNRNEFCRKVSNAIKEFYTGMKSGSSGGYIYDYMWNEQYKNEKDMIRHMKQNKNNIKTKKYRYVRSLLGISSIMGNARISSREIARAESPIQFNVIGEYIFIRAKEIDETFYKKKFTFNINKKDYELATPDNIDMQDFLKSYVEKIYIPNLERKVTREKNKGGENQCVTISELQ